MQAKPICERQAQLVLMFDKYVKKDKPVPRARTHNTSPSVSEIVKAALASYDSVFIDLYHGNFASYASQSEAEQAFLNQVAWWCVGDMQKMDAIYRQSSLYRDKWERQDYSTKTMQNAVNLLPPEGGYRPQRYFDERLGTHVNVAQEQHPQPNQWEQPIPFEEMELPDIEADRLPTTIKNFCLGVAEFLQVHVGMVMCVVFAVISTAIQGKYVVRVREDYLEPTNTYWYVISNPSELKSPTLKICKIPIHLYEKAKNAEEEPIIKQLLEENATITKAIEHRRGLAAKAKTREDRERYMQEIAELQKELKKIPTLTRLTADDTTQEALGVLMWQNDGKMAILEAEPAFLENMLGRYDTKGQPNMDLYLKAFSVEQKRIDRRSNGMSITIDKPHLTLLMMPQPHVLQHRQNSDASRHRGGDARPMYYFPRSLVGYRNLEPMPIEKSVKKAYIDKILSLLHIPQEHTEDGSLKAHELNLTPEAYAIWLEFGGEIEKNLRPHGDFATMQDFGGKLRGNTARLAGVLHCAAHETPQNHDISGETMETACYMMSVFVEHGKAAYCLMGQEKSVNDAQRVLKWILGHNVRTFTVRDCHIAVKNTVKTSPEVSAALEILEDRSYVAKVQIPKETLI